MPPPGAAFFFGVSARLLGRRQHKRNLPAVKKSIQRVVEKVHAPTDRLGTWQETRTLVSKGEPHAARMIR
jgi:hypothetical protein